jgi:hypothetical protein
MMIFYYLKTRYFLLLEFTTHFPKINTLNRGILLDQALITCPLTFC